MTPLAHDLETVLDAIRGTGRWAAPDPTQSNSSGGNKTTVARRLNISRTTLYKYIKRWKTVEDAFEEEENAMLDLTLNRHWRNVDRGDVASIIFTLKTRGKHLGWTEKWDFEMQKALQELELLKHEVKEALTPPVMEEGRFELSAMQIAPSFASVYRDIISGNHQEYIFKGGRGSTKSSFASEVLLQLLINNPQWHVLCLRQVANTMRDSVFSQITWAIGYLGLQDKFKTTTSPLEITYRPTGQKIYFRGGDDPNKIKSIKPQFGYIGVLWFEELDQFHGQNSIRNIVQSAIRGGDRAVILKSFNPPRSINNWVHKDLQIPRENRYVHESDYRSVPEEWLGRAFLNEAEFLREANPPAYEHEYLGVANAAGGMVFENVIIRDITDEEIYGKPDERGRLVGGFDRIYRGLDFGYYPDPAHYAVCYFRAATRELYIFGEFRGWKLSNRKLYDKIVEKFDLQPGDDVIADSAEPKSIGDLREYGMAARGAEKGQDSVYYSMKWLQSIRAIIIDNKRCPYTAEEFLGYEYERNKDDEIITGYPDADNHAIDAVRYATNRVWKRRGA